MLREHERKNKIFVENFGNVNHRSDERRARFIRGTERDELKKVFADCKIKPSTMYNAKIDALDAESITSGNRSGAGASKSVLQKLSSEARQESTLSKNVWESLKLAKETLLESEEKCKSVGGTIQFIAIDPLVIHLWTVRQIRLWHELCQKKFPT